MSAGEFNNFSAEIGADGKQVTDSDAWHDGIEESSKRLFYCVGVCSF